MTTKTPAGSTPADIAAQAQAAADEHARLTAQADLVRVAGENARKTAELASLHATYRDGIAAAHAEISQAAAELQTAAAAEPLSVDKLAAAWSRRQCAYSKLAAVVNHVQRLTSADPLPDRLNGTMRPWPLPEIPQYQKNTFAAHLDDVLHWRTRNAYVAAHSELDAAQADALTTAQDTAEQSAAAAVSAGQPVQTSPPTTIRERYAAEVAKIADADIAAASKGHPGGWMGAKRELYDAVLSDLISADVEDSDGS